MKLKKLCYATFIILATCLIQNASATTYTWIDSPTAGYFNNPNNWSPTGVPGPADTAVIGFAFDNNDWCIIAAGDTESVGTNGAPSAFAGVINGPQWGSRLDVYGTLNIGFLMCPCQWDASGPRGQVNVYNGGCINGTNSSTFLDGDTWWWVSQPYFDVNLYGNGIIEVSYMSFGSVLNIYDQATNLVTTFLDMGPPTTGNWGQGGATDANRHINVAGGYFIGPTGNGQTFTNWIGRGIFYAYGKQYDTNEFIITDDGTYTYATVIPLGGVMSSLGLTVPRSTMMVGDIQTPVALANFPGVQNVPLTGVDNAQRGVSGTLTYNSSDPTVVQVTGSDQLKALKKGTATITASYSSFNSSGVVVTVNAYTNSLIHRYSFSESSGSGTTADSVPPADGTWDGTLDAGATLGGGQVTFAGNDGNYDADVVLPAGIVSGMDAVTIEAWANLGINNTVDWTPLFAFGAIDGQTPALGMNYIAFQPFTGAIPPTANLLFGTGDPGYVNEQDATLQLVSGGVTNFLNGYMHIVGVFHPYAGYVALYTNGVLAVINHNVSNPLAAALGADPKNFLGESLYANDPFFVGSIDEFRIYNGPLTAGQILADYALGPNQLIGTSRNTTLSASVTGDPSLVLSWPTSSALVSVYSSPVLGPGASWSPVIAPMTVVGANYQMTVPMTSDLQFFRLQQY